MLRSVPARLLAVAITIVVGALAACSSGTSASEPDSASSAAGQFPVSIEHAFGSTTVESEPTKIVTLGVTDADPVLALGVTPIAVTGYSFYPETGLGPWAEERVEGEMPQRLQSDSEPNVEAIAALEPDLIVGVSAGFEQAVYDQLAQIAPTIARPAEHAAYTVPRAEATRMIATAMGHPDEGEKLITDADRALADAAESNPEFADKTATVVLPYDGTYGAYLPGDARGRVMTELGFQVPDKIAAEDDGSSYFIEISRERLDLIDADVLVLLADQSSARDFVENDEILQNLPVVADGRMIIPDTDTRGAMTYNSVLSIPYAADRLVPELQDALG